MTVATAPSELSAKLLSVARTAASAGVEVAIDWARRRADLRVEEKAGPDDLVSQADRQTERAIRAVLAELRPADGIVGEEAGATVGAGDIEWHVDPIDGTTNYLYGRPDWAVSVAAIHGATGRTLVGVVAEPALGLSTEATRDGGAWREGRRLTVRREADGLERALIEVNWGTRGQRDRSPVLTAALLGAARDVRRAGSAAAALVGIADGRADAFWGPGLRSWDGAAGALIAAEAGAWVGDLAGETEGDWPRRGDVLAAAPRVEEELRPALRAVYS